jgi:uncharacterized RDD family membrane protein YckC
VQFDERLTIDTPEQITLELPLAGIGSRFLAVAFDTVLQGAMYVTAAIALAISGRTVRGVPALLQQLGPSVAVLFLFCVYWGYFALFEIVWSGRTPGKRLAGIRVIKESGRPINAYESIGRNVLRAVDFLPAMYALGVIVMMLNRHSRRIGDFVAGTVVVYDTPLDESIPARYAAEDGTAVTAASIARVTTEELQLVEAYLQRRFELAPFVRDDMAEKIAARLTKTIGAGPEPNQHVDDFLESIARRVRDSARFR